MGILTSDDQYYWAVDFPGMTELQAEQLRLFTLDKQFELPGIPGSPADWWTARLNRREVATILAALRLIGGGIGHDSLVEELEDWLSLAERSNRVTVNFEDQEAHKTSHHWFLDVPGLTESQAEVLRNLASQAMNLDGVMYNPRYWWTAHLGRTTADRIRRALTSTTAADASSDPELSSTCATGLIRVIDDWIKYASRLTGDK